MPDSLRIKGKDVFEYLVLFLVLAGGLFVIINWPAMHQEVQYSIAPATLQRPATPPPAQRSTTPTLEIKKIGLSAPIRWDIPASQVVDHLDEGLVHLAGSARPGEVGNTFIIGHSSDYVWKHDPYAAVFALLPKLVKGDQILLHSETTDYTYEVTETFVVSPYDVSVADSLPTPTLTLMTCYPVGTAQNRFIVRARQLNPPASKDTGTFKPQQPLQEIQFR